MKADRVQSVLFIGSLVMVPILLVLGRSLLSIWITFVSLQLISHTVLVNTLMSAELVLFLRKINCFLRPFSDDIEPDTDSAE